MLLLFCIPIQIYSQNTACVFGNSGHTLTVGKMVTKGQNEHVFNSDTFKMEDLERESDGMGRGALKCFFKRNIMHGPRLTFVDCSEESR